MLTEIIENDIKVQYLKKYCEQLQESISHQVKIRWKICAYEEREKFDKSTEGKYVKNIEDVIGSLRTEIQKLQKEILNNTLKERGLPELKEPFYLQF